MKMRLPMQNGLETLAYRSGMGICWGSNVSNMYYWGTELKPSGEWTANIYQGNFPRKNTLEDGFAEAAPVKTFPPNSYGLYDMDGNIWEWCQGFYRPDY